MAIYKDVEPLEVVAYKSRNKDFDDGVQFILEKLDAFPQQMLRKLSGLM